MIETNRPGQSPQFIYPVMDPRGTITKYVESDGTTVLASQEYDAFGNLIPNSATGTWPGRFGYQGETWQEIFSNNGSQRLLLSPTRLYDPVTGRFLQNEMIYSRRALNHYLYSRQNPIMSLDPLGLQEEWWSPGNLWARASGFVEGVVTEGLPNVADAFNSAVIGTVNAMIHPVNTYNAAVDNIADTLYQSYEEGVGTVLSNAWGGLVANFDENPSEFLASTGVNLMLMAAPVKMPPGIAQWMESTTVGQQLLRIGRTEITFGETKVCRTPRKPSSIPGTMTLFGQRRISPAFGVGTTLEQVASDLRAGLLSPTDFIVEVFIDENGNIVAINNRSLGALSMADMYPTSVWVKGFVDDMPQNILNRLSQAPIIDSPVIGPSIPVTIGRNGPITRIITIPGSR